MSAPHPTPHVTSIEALDRRGRRVRIHLDDGEPLELALEVVERTGLGAGDPLDEALRATLVDADLRWRAREAALTYLAHRPRSRAETRRRLGRRKFPAEVVERCLEELTAKGLLDDDAFADVLVRDRLRRSPRGPARLRDELCRRGLSPVAAADAVTRGLRESGTTDEDLAIEAALGWLARRGARERDALASDAPVQTHARNGRLDRASPRGASLHRLSSFLRGRGFGFEAVRAGVAAAEARARTSVDPAGAPEGGKHGGMTG